MTYYGFGWKVRHSRKFGGKTYYSDIFSPSKAEAHKLAKYYREVLGLLCRVVLQKYDGKDFAWEGKMVYYIYEENRQSAPHFSGEVNAVHR